GHPDRQPRYGDRRAQAVGGDRRGPHGVPDQLRPGDSAGEDLELAPAVRRAAEAVAHHGAGAGVVPANRGGLARGLRVAVRQRPSTGGIPRATPGGLAGVCLDRSRSTPVSKPAPSSPGPACARLLPSPTVGSLGTPATYTVVSSREQRQRRNLRNVAD